MKPSTTSENKELISKTIGALRFPLMVLVVMVHVQIGEINGVYVLGDNFPLYKSISSFISVNIASCAVPLFFIISGYLFFNKIVSFSFVTYKDNLRKRVKSLFFPYVIWNLVAISFLFFEQILNPHTNFKLVSDYTFADWFWPFWDSTKVISGANLPQMGDPIASQMWFIRDLMVVVLFSPIIYLLIKKLSYIIVILLGICFIFGWGIEVPGFFIVAPFFFSLGAYFSINKKDPIDFLYKALPYSILLYVLIIISTYIYSEFEYINIIRNIGLIVLVALALGLTFRFVANGKLIEKKLLTSSNMFVFGIHTIVLRILYKVIFTIIMPLTPETLVIGYFIVGILTILISLGIYYVLHRYLPRFTAVLTGGR